MNRRGVGSLLVMAAVGLLFSMTAGVSAAQETGLEVVEGIELSGRVQGNTAVVDRPDEPVLEAQAIPGVPNVAPGALFGFLPLNAFGVVPTPIGDEEIINFTGPQFVYNGETYTSLGVDSNGYLIVGGGVPEDNNCCDLPPGPSPDRPNNILAPFWTDLDGTGTPGIYIDILTDGVNSWIVVEWQVNVFGTSSNRHFQVWIGVNGIQDISFAYDPAGLPADPGQDFLLGAENRLGQGDVDPLLPTVDQRVTTANEPPLVNAGPNQTTTGGTVSLNGAATDADGPPPRPGPRYPVRQPR